MRYTATFFWAMTGLALLAKLALGDGTDTLRMLVVILAAAFFMTALLWTLYVLRRGGPRKFYADNAAWKQRRGQLPELVPTIDVDTATVVQEYRAKWSTYLPWARGQVVFAIPAVPFCSTPCRCWCSAESSVRPASRWRSVSVR